MTRRQELERHRHTMGEIREIMNSMKTLAYMETRKLDRFTAAQHAVVDGIEALAMDFIGFHPETLPETDQAGSVYVLIGTERGFCGDFNQSLMRRYESVREDFIDESPHLIAIGRKLHALLDREEQPAVLIEGASIVEEVDVVLDTLVRQLVSSQQRHGLLAVYVIYHDQEGDIVMQKLLPPFQHCLNQPVRFAHPPVLNLTPAEFMIELTEQYLFAVLHGMLYASLMAENHNRVMHLEGAVRHLDSESAELTRRCHALRQEEIIEEIEVILLSAGGPDQGGTGHG
jgi:F-type H+-transporting ATPase subunit gamma